MTDQMNPMKRKMPISRPRQPRVRTCLLRAKAKAGEERHRGSPQQDQDQEQPPAVRPDDCLAPSPCGAAQVPARRGE